MDPCQAVKVLVDPLRCLSEAMLDDNDQAEAMLCCSGWLGNRLLPAEHSSSWARSPRNRELQVGHP